MKNKCLTFYRLQKKFIELVRENKSQRRSDNSKLTQSWEWCNFSYESGSMWDVAWKPIYAYTACMNWTD